MRRQPREGLDRGVDDPVGEPGREPERAPTPGGSPASSSRPAGPAAGAGRRAPRRSRPAGTLVGSIIATIIRVQPTVNSAASSGQRAPPPRRRGGGSARTASPPTATARARPARRAPTSDPTEDRPVATRGAEVGGSEHRPVRSPPSGGEAEVALEGVVVLEVDARDAVRRCRPSCTGSPCWRRRASPGWC